MGFLQGLSAIAGDEDLVVGALEVIGQDIGECGCCEWRRLADLRGECLGGLILYVTVQW